MKFLPDKDEAVALAAVWLIWPALHLTKLTMTPILAEFSVCLPLPTRAAFEIVRLSDNFCIPSLLGMLLIVFVDRLVPRLESKRFLLHLITFVAFDFTVLTLLIFQTVARIGLR